MHFARHMCSPNVIFFLPRVAKKAAPSVKLTFLSVIAASVLFSSVTESYQVPLHEIRGPRRTVARGVALLAVRERMSGGVAAGNPVRDL